MILAEKILALRTAQGWSQEELAEKLEVSRQSVSKWESAGSIPDLHKILQLAQLFGVSTDYLLGMKTSAAVSVEGLTKEDVEMVYALINHLWRKNHIPGEY